MEKNTLGIAQSPVLGAQEGNLRRLEYKSCQCVPWFDGLILEFDQLMKK